MVKLPGRLVSLNFQRINKKRKKGAFPLGKHPRFFKVKKKGNLRIKELSPTQTFEKMRTPFPRNNSLPKEK